MVVLLFISASVALMQNPKEDIYQDEQTNILVGCLSPIVVSQKC
jgi:hypothetical protein